MLNKCRVINLIIAVFFKTFGIVCLATDDGLHSGIADMVTHDFHYKVNLAIETQQNIINKMYSIFSGSEIEDAIKELRTFTEENKTVSNMKTLHDRINTDIATIYKKVHALGFYGANIRYNIKQNDEKHVAVEIKISLGKIFKLRLNITYINQNDEFNQKYKKILRQNLEKYSSAIADIKQLIKDAVHDLQSSGYYDPQVLEKKIHLNYKTHEAILYLTIAPQKQMKFSSVKINAFPGINNEYIKNRIMWQEGEIYDIGKIESTSQELQNSLIFSKIKIKPMTNDITEDKIPMMIAVEEDKKHVIDFSLLYSGMRNDNYEKSSQKNSKLKSIITRLSLTRNNAFGNGEKLCSTVEGTPAKIHGKRADYAFEVEMTQPDVFFKNNYAQYLCSRRQELTNIFFKKSDKFSLMFNYPLWFFTATRIGALFEKNYIDGEKFLQKSNHYKSITVPIELILDKTDDLLNPTKGYRTSIKFQNICFKSAQVNYLQYLDVNFSYNYDIDKQKKNIIAFNISKKTIFGGNINDIPIDKRIYAGGMNSVRGYAKQLASERISLDGSDKNTHMGGKSSIEFNTEIRRKFTKDFGGVLFFDGAKIFQNKPPQNWTMKDNKRWFLSYGVGIRYFTSIGPLRIDFAFPIKRRKAVDSRMQFIISLGQAF